MSDLNGPSAFKIGIVDRIAKGEFLFGKSYLIYCLGSNKTLLAHFSVGEYNTLFFKSVNTRKSRPLRGEDLLL